MNINYQILALCLTWVAQVLFCVALIPQIKLNFKLKTSKGLSDYLLFGYLNGYISYVYYVYLLNFPLAYKIMVPLACVLTFILFVQRFYYSNFNKKDKKFFVLVLTNFFLALLILPFALKNSFLMGNIFGWITMLIWAIYHIPQIIKVFANKSVRGFSFALVSFLVMGEITEFIGAIILGLPVPTILNGLRGMFIYCIFCIQFLLYSTNKEVVKSKPVYSLSKPVTPVRPQVHFVLRNKKPINLFAKRISLFG